MLYDQELAKYIKQTAKENLFIQKADKAYSYLVCSNAAIFRMRADQQKAWRELEKVFGSPLPGCGVAAGGAKLPTPNASTVDVLRVYNERAGKVYGKEVVKTDLLEQCRDDGCRKKALFRIFIGKDCLIRVDERYASVLPDYAAFKTDDNGVALFDDDIMIAYVCKYIRGKKQIYDAALASCYDPADSGDKG
jgi:hypothetical protein